MGRAVLRRVPLQNGNCLYRNMLPGGCKEGVSFPLPPTLETPEILLDPMAIWATCVLPYQQLSIDQQRDSWFMDRSSRMNRHHPVWRTTTLIEEGKINSAH